MIIDRLRLIMETGLATQTGQGADPVVTMRISEDYGQTFGPEVQASIGQVGKTMADVLFTRVGSSENSLVPEFVITDPVPTRIVGCDVEGDNLGIGQ